MFKPLPLDLASLNAQKSLLVPILFHKGGLQDNKYFLKMAKTWGA